MAQTIAQTMAQTMAQTIMTQFTPPLPPFEPVPLSMTVRIDKNSLKYELNLKLKEDVNYSISCQDIDSYDDSYEDLNTGDYTCHYTDVGDYNITVKGDLAGMKSGGTNKPTPNTSKLISLNQWGSSKWTDLSEAFAYCENMELLADDVPNLAGVGSLERMFIGTKKFDQDISEWDVSSVTTMKHMFNESIFNQDISGWNVSSVEDMSYMFSNGIFNQDIGEWDVSSVTDMWYMFQKNKQFNKDIGNWNVGNVTEFHGMFMASSSFNKYIGDWDVSSATNMQMLFFSARAFNQDISDWNVSSVTNMTNAFSYAYKFDQNISKWGFGKTEYISNFIDKSGLSEENHKSLKYKLQGHSQISKIGTPCYVPDANCS